MDVIATDAGGRPIDSLAPGDFEITEDGKPQSIDEARLIRIDKSLPSEDYARPQPAEDSERTTASRPNTRLFAIFLDEYHVSAANSSRVRDALTRFVDETLGPRDLLAVMRPLDSLFAIQMTRDRAQAREVLAAFEGRRADYTPRNAYERNYFAGTPARIDQVRAQVTTSALNALAIHLGSLNNETPQDAGRRQRRTAAGRSPARAGVAADDRLGDSVGQPLDGVDLCRRSSRVDGRRGTASRTVPIACRR